MAIRDPISCARVCTGPGGWKSDDGGRDDVWRATEALAAIPGRFDHLLTCAQLSHTRSTRGSAVKSRNLLKKDLILTLVT